MGQIILKAPRDLINFFRDERDFRGIQRYFQDVEQTATETLKQVVNVTQVEYTPTIEDDELHVDTSAGDVAINLPGGVEGKKYRILNISFSGNRVIITPNVGDLLFGLGDPEYAADGEVLIMTFSTVSGWN